jgi:hypothetical protein
MAKRGENVAKYELPSKKQPTPTAPAQQALVSGCEAGAG